MTPMTAGDTPCELWDDEESLALTPGTAVPDVDVVPLLAVCGLYDGEEVGVLAATLVSEVDAGVEEVVEGVVSTLGMVGGETVPATSDVAKTGVVTLPMAGRTVLLGLTGVVAAAIVSAGTVFAAKAAAVSGKKLGMMPLPPLASELPSAAAF